MRHSLAKGGALSGRRRALVATVLTAGLALTACGAGGDGTGGDGGTDAGSGTAAGAVDEDAIIEAGISYTLGTGFDPMITTGAVTVAANWHTMEGLTELDPVTREVYAALASGMPTQVDELTYEATLRDDAVFHDGSPVTTEDVVFSFERVLDPENASLYAGFIGFVDSVTAKDDTTVTITLKYPFSLVNERLSVVKIVPKAVVEADIEAFNALPTGTGPYKITSAVADDKITFERFDEYTGPRPAKAAGMNWNLLSDPAARVTAMRSGTIHAMEDVPYIDADGLANDVAVESVQTFGVLFMMFNTDQAPFDDKRVRQAFFYALDMEKIIDNGLLGNAEAASSFLQTTHPDYQEAGTVYSYDPEKARQLLADAGVDGLDITLLTTDTGWVADVAPLIKEDLDAVGISTTLDIAQSASQYSKVDAGELEVMVAPGDPSVFGNDPDLLMRWWYGDNVWSQSRYRWSDTPEFAELQSLLDAGAQASGEEQQQIWGDAFDLISDEVPLYPLLHRQLPTAWDDEALDGFRPVPLTGLSFLDVGVVE
jgi:peptide/nickel transport system substrate-binding protein